MNTTDSGMPWGEALNHLAHVVDVYIRAGKSITALIGNDKAKLSRLREAMKALGYTAAYKRLCKE